MSAPAVEHFDVGSGRTLWRYRSHGAWVVWVTTDGKPLTGRARTTEKGKLVLELVDETGEVRANTVVARAW